MKKTLSLTFYRSIRVIAAAVVFFALSASNQPIYGIPSVIRGPYLQSASSATIVIRWRTDEATNSRVQFGNAVGSLDKVANDAAVVTEHEIKLTGLSPKTKYYYSIGSSNGVLQGDVDNYFETTPIPGSIGKYRIGVFGDCGNNSVNQVNTRDQFTTYLGPNYMNAWILLGDNAYSFGTDVEYQSNFFNIYRDNFLKKSPLFPSPGNHDYADNPGRQDDHAIPYYDVFTLPKQGESGGSASGTEAYYSFDYGNIHFLSLDSYGKEDNTSRLYDTLGKQVTWIKKDLAANTNKDWVVAYWHHPPYTKGSHDSDTEAALIKIRTDFIRILERNGVDLILCGHSHDYERSKLIQGHFGLENSFNPAVHQLSNSSGAYDGSPNSCPYEKKLAKNRGTVYVVSGSAGQLGGSSANYPHDAMPFSDATHGGAMILEVEGNRLDAKWIGADGVIRDKFTIEKDVSKKTDIVIDPGASVTLNPSYIGNYIWNTGAVTKSIVVSPTENTQYIVKDNLACIADTFNVKIPALPVQLVSFEGSVDDYNRVNLNWATSLEDKASFFVVERSTDGKTFVGIIRKPAKGKSSQFYSYYAKDSTAASEASTKLYYRLKQVDENGAFAYSKMITVDLNAASAGFDFTLIPNPSSGQEVMVSLNQNREITAQLAVYSSTGNLIHEEKTTFVERKKMTFPEKMPAGVYFVKVTADGKSLTKKLVIR